MASLHTRRDALRTLARVPLAVAFQAAPPIRLRMLLNSGFTGANAWFALADDRGYLRKAGLEISFTPGVGAYTAAPRMAEEGFDIGYGDINALVEEAAHKPDRAPIAVYVLFNQSPSTIVVAGNSTIRGPRDLEGRSVVGHATDVALNTFGAYAESSGVRASAVSIRRSEAGMRELVEEMLAGGAAGVFGYITTIAAAARSAKIDVDQRLRFLLYRDVVPDLYGSALMMSRRLVQEQPSVATAVVKTFHQGVVEAIRQPADAIAAVGRRDPSLDPAIETGRLLGTVSGEMAHPEGRRIGIGDLDAERFARSVRLLAKTNELPRVPSVDQIFTREFLPPLVDRRIDLPR